MNNEILSIRASADNPNHNLWLNNGTWSVAYTVHLPNQTKKRVRQSLGTKKVALARQRRDDLLARYQTKDGRISAKAEEVTVTPFNVTQFGVPVRPAIQRRVAGGASRLSKAAWAAQGAVSSAESQKQEINNNNVRKQ